MPEPSPPAHESGGLISAVVADVHQLNESTWEHLSEWPMTGAALLFLGGYAWPILDTGLAAGWRSACDVVVLVTWIGFIVDFVMRVLLAPRRASYLAHHVVDLATVALPVLRPLRLLRLVVLLRVLDRSAANSIHGRVATYAGGFTVLVVFCGALAVLDAERGAAHANITNFGDALWWAATTITTVGYGDRFPVTEEGRYVAVGLMIAGITLIGMVTAAMASWVIERIRRAEEVAEVATRADLVLLREEIASLRRELIERPRARP